MHEVAQILASQMLSEENHQMETDEQYQVGTQVGFDRNIEDLNSDFNAEVFQDALEEVQNVLVEPSIPSVDQLSVDPAPQASRSLPSIEVQLMAQKTPNLNITTSTMESEAGKFLISPLPTPYVLPSPPLTTNKNTTTLPNIPDLFESLKTFCQTKQLVKHLFLLSLQNHLELRNLPP